MSEPTLTSGDNSEVRGVHHHAQLPHAGACLDIYALTPVSSSARQAVEGKVWYDFGNGNLPWIILNSGI